MRNLVVTVLAVSFLCGCASAPRHALYDGAPVRAAPVEPVTTYTPRGAGLPEYWGAPEPKAEQSPHKRVLPETPDTRREPGIWATKEPALEGPMVFDVSLPYPEHATAEEREPTDVCANLINSFLVPLPSDPPIRYGRWSVTERGCAAATLYVRCVEHFQKKFASAKDYVNSGLAERLRKARRTAEALKDLTCAGVSLTGEPQDTVDKVSSIFMKKEVSH